MLIFSAIYLELSTFMFIFANEIRQWKETFLKDKVYEDEQNYGRDSWFYLSGDETTDGDDGGHSQPYLRNP